MLGPALGAGCYRVNNTDKNLCYHFIVQSLSGVWFCHTVDCSISGYHALHYLREFAQTHIHWVDDAVQPSHPLLPSSSPALNLWRKEEGEKTSEWAGDPFWKLKWLQNPTISSSVIPFSSCPQSFPASGSFLMSQLFISGGQSIGLASVLPMNIQAWFSLGLTGLISLQSKGLSRVFSNTTVQKHQFFGAQLSL